MANTTTSIVTFSVLSPDTSLSYDRIKLRLEEYRTLLASGSDTIELSTENGKTVICRKRAKEMEEFLDQAEILLRDVVQSRDMSTLVVLHHLRDLTEILDKLQLHDECRLTGDCALGLAEALGRRSLEFRQEQADIFVLIAGLTVYQPRARTLFIRAVSICEEVVDNDGSHSNKKKLLDVLGSAGTWASGSPGALGAQWLESAVQLMANELPPSMVHHDCRRAIYYNYGNCLSSLNQHANATMAYRESLSSCRILVNNNPVKYKYRIARTLMYMASTFDDLGQYEAAIVAFQEVLDIGVAMSAQDPLQFNELMARTLINYGITLGNLNRFSEAAEMQKEAALFYRKPAPTGREWEWTRQLYSALYFYGSSCYSLGEHAEAVLAYQESIVLQRTRASTHPQEEVDLARALHNIANSFNALGNRVEANAAAIEALQRNHGRVFEPCIPPSNLMSCLVCQRVMTGEYGRGTRPRVVPRE